jgi:hypothetical protein
VTLEGAMNADDYRSLQPSSRPVERTELPAGPAKNLRDAVYHLYAEAGCPVLDKLGEFIAVDDSLPGSPRKDLIGRIVAGAGLASQQDTVTVAVALARAAGHDDTFTIGDKIRQLWITAVTSPAVPASVRIGTPISECDALDLEVHPAITVSGQASSTPALPTYVKRVHDVRLGQLAAQAVAGSSQMITLVGGSSTGKTRACWELIQRLDAQQPGRWLVWHPYDPTRPEAAAAVLDQAGPDTIVWLNEAQYYLAPSDPRLGEQVAAGLRTLLDTPVRGPVLILATLWPQFWTTLSVRPDADRPDPHAQARDLLTGTDIDIPDTFTTTDLTLLGRAADPRLQHAAEHAEAARITQYLAGTPELENRYRKAPPAARAIIDVAIDARRLGHPPAIPHSLLSKAAPGYLDDYDWDSLGDDWLEQALAYTAQHCRGARGPLTRIRPRTGQRDSQPVYRLADYLEQIGQTERTAIFPPGSFWNSAITAIDDPGVLREIARQAAMRGRYGCASHLYRNAADRGDASASSALDQLESNVEEYRTGSALFSTLRDFRAEDLSWLREQLGLPDEAPASPGRAADDESIRALGYLAGKRVNEQDLPGAESLYMQVVERVGTRPTDAGARQHALSELGKLRERVGDLVGAESFYLQAVVAGLIGALVSVARVRMRIGNPTSVYPIAIQAANHGHPWALPTLARLYEHEGDWVTGRNIERFGLANDGRPANSLDTDL